MDRRRGGESPALRVSAEKTAGLREKEVHPAVVVLGRDAVLEHTVPAQPNSEAGKAGQPAVVVSAAEAQAEAAAVIARRGPAPGRCPAGREGGVRWRLQDPEGRRDQGRSGSYSRTSICRPGSIRADPPACPGR